MNSTRVTGDGTIDFIGQTVGTLRVNGLAARSGQERRFTVTCEQCGSQGVSSYTKLRYGGAKCQNAGCGKTSQRRGGNTLGDRQRSLEQIEAQRRAEELAVSQARMDAETEGYTVPSRIRPAAEHVVLSERERIASRQRREELAAEEAAEREARERPAREAEAQLQETHRRIAGIEWQRLTDPNIIDVAFWQDPQHEGLDGISIDGVKDWNNAAFRNFARSHPEFAITDENLSLLNSYFAKHQVLLFSTEMLERVYRRMVAAGIQFTTTELTPSPVIEEKVVPGTVQPVESKNPEEPKPVLYDGFDLVTGEARQFTSREIDKMSADDMKKALQMTARGTLKLPNVGPGPKGRSF